MAGYRRVEGTEEIIWRGRSYRRFPDHRLRHRRVYFMATTYPRTYLHRDIYTAHHGPIPEGWHVHHIDHDPLNNDPANLASISAEEHLRHHGEHRSEFIAVCDECGQRYPAKRKGARWCSPACKERRRRRDGVAYKRPAKGKMAEIRKCATCVCEFTARKPWAKFCGMKCRNIFNRRARKVNAA